MSTLRQSLGRIGFGGAPLGNLFAPLSEEQAIGAVTAALDAGITYLDTSPLYGHGLSEQRIGQALKGRQRDSFILSTKVGRRLVPASPSEVDGGAYQDIPPFKAVYDYSFDGALRSVDDSLERLGLDHIDILYIHDIDRFTHGAEQPRHFRDAMEGAYRALHRLREEGSVRAIGLGVNEWEVCEEASRHGDFDGFLLAGRYTLLEQGALETFLPGCVTRDQWIALGGAYNSGILATGAVPGAMYNYEPAPPDIRARVDAIEAVCRAHGVPLAAAAIQFPLAHPAVACVVSGLRSADELARNLGLMDRAIPAGLWRDLKSAGLLRPDAPVPMAATSPLLSESAAS